MGEVKGILWGVIGGYNLGVVLGFGKAFLWKYYGRKIWGRRWFSMMVLGVNKKIELVFKYYSLFIRFKFLKYRICKEKYNK